MSNYFQEEKHGKSGTNSKFRRIKNSKHTLLKGKTVSESSTSSSGAVFLGSHFVFLEGISDGCRDIFSKLLQVSSP